MKQFSVKYMDSGVGPGWNYPRHKMKVEYSMAVNSKKFQCGDGRFTGIYSTAYEHMTIIKEV